MSNRQKLNNNTFLQRKRSIKSKEIDSQKNQFIKPKIGTWDEAEDNKLKDWVKKNGAYNWTVCAEYMKNRSAKQCREHWKNTIAENLIKGQWTAEEDLLIMKFYEKYESWRKMIPMFENRTENSIKNRFFSQLRKIVVKKRPPNGKKEYGTKYGLDTLKKYLNEGIEEAEKRYYEENKNMTKADFENYMIQIENLIKNRKKGEKFININSLKGKGFIRKKSVSKIINIDEDKEDKYEELSDKENDENNETFNNINKKRSKKKGKNTDIFKTIKNSDEDNVTTVETTNMKELIKFGKKKSKSKKIEYTPPIEEKVELDETKEQNEITIERRNSKKDIKNIIINQENKRISKQNSKQLERKNSKANANNNNYNNNDHFPVPYNYNEFHINMPKTGELSRSNSIILNENENNNGEKERKKQQMLLSKTSRNIKKALKGRYINMTSLGQSGEIEYVHP